MSIALNYQATVAIVTCATCGGPIALTNENQLRDAPGTSFFCPLGHTNVFGRSSEADRLKAELLREKQRREMAEATATAEAKRAQSAERAAGRLRKRVSNGVCPCCNRTFQNLARHMKTKHPESP